EPLRLAQDVVVDLDVRPHTHDHTLAGVYRPALARLHEQALALAVVEVDDLRKRARGLTVRELRDVDEARLLEQLPHEARDERRPRIAVPDELHDELAPDVAPLLVGNEEEVAVAAPVRGERPLQVGQGEAQDASRLEDAPQLSDDRKEVRVGHLRKGVDADGVVDRVVRERQALPDVADQVDAGPLLGVRVDPTWEDVLPAAPVEPCDSRHPSSSSRRPRTSLASNCVSASRRAACACSAYLEQISFTPSIASSSVL